MRLTKALIATAIAAALLVVPAGALAKRDRDHDRMPDKWEKRHHLNVHANDARKDPDGDHLSNLSEFRHHTDPQKADTDNDGIDDENELRDNTNPRRDDSDNDGVDDADEISGSIVSFESGVLTIQLAGNGAGTVSGTVNDSTQVECDDDSAPTTASASRDGADDNSGSGTTEDNSGSGTTEDNSGSGSADDNSGPGSGSTGSDDGANHDAGDDDQNEDQCTTGDLKAGARVHEAKLMKATDGSSIFTKIELVPAA